MGVDVTATNRLGQIFDFKAGSHAGYVRWLGEMSCIVGEDTIKRFYPEHFDAEECKALAWIIETHKEKAALRVMTSMPGEYGKWFMNRLFDWQRAFEIGSYDGSVEVKS
jgi:hypothetical protein